MEIAILSGKGGTGKTTIATALSELIDDVVKIDCDVDAPNLYLFYGGKNIKSADFSGSKKAVIDEDLCIKCGKCEQFCKFNAIKDCKIDELSCEGCGSCALVCPKDAIRLEDEKSADMYITETEKGIIARAQMEIGSDGSGKLITELKKQGREFAKKDSIVITDGSPGIGCPVIASIAGSNAIVVVTEPTQSGLEDLKRVEELCEYFGVFTMVCINKFDINLDISLKIEEFAKLKNLDIVGKIPYDELVMKSINELKPIVYYKESKANEAIRDMWSNIKNIIFK